MAAQGYPPDLGHGQGSAAGAKQRPEKFVFCGISIDPMTARMGLRAVQDDPDSTSWGGKNVFDGIRKSTAPAMDGPNIQTGSSEGNGNCRKCGRKSGWWVTYVNAKAD